MRQLLTAILLAASCSAAITNQAVTGLTSRQAIVSFDCNIGPCTVVVADKSGVTIDDTSETLFPGSSSATRVGSIVDRKRISFVIGTPTAAKGSDNLMHSRAIGTGLSYVATITDTGDASSVTVRFTAGALPAGNMYPEQVGYDTNGFGNAALPSIDTDGTGVGCGQFVPFTGVSKPCIDPLTGIQYFLFTTPGAHGGLANLTNSTGSGGSTTFLTPTVLAGSVDVPANMVNNPGVNYANLTGLTSVVMAANHWAAPNTFGDQNPFGVSYANSVWTPGADVDDVIVSLSCDASTATGSSNVLSVWLVDANNIPLSSQQTVTCPVGTTKTTFTVPHATPKPYWQDWGFAPDQGYAPSPRLKITRQGSTGSVDVSVWFSAAVSYVWSNNEVQPIRCEDSVRAIGYDRLGNAIATPLVGYLCFAGPFAANPDVWLFIPFNADGTARAETRYLGTLTGTYSGGQAAINIKPSGFYNGDIYGLDIFVTPPNVAKLHYNTTLYAWCHYQDLRTVSDPVNGGWYPSNNNTNAQPAACFDKTYVTTGAVAAIKTAWAALHPDQTDVSNWTAGGGYFQQGVVSIPLLPNPADGAAAPQIAGFFSPAGTLLGVTDNWTNHYWNGSAYAPKMGWAVTHGPFAGSPGAQYASSEVQHNTFTPNSGFALQGPWLVPVVKVNRAGFGSAAAWDCVGCGGGARQDTTIGPALSSVDMYQCPNNATTRKLCPDGLGGAGSCCVQIQVAQEPCSIAPYSGTTFGSGTQTEAQAFPCTKTDNTTVVNAAYSKLQNMQVGDVMAEYNTAQNADANWEKFFIAEKDLDGGGNVNALWLLREAHLTVDTNYWAPLSPHRALLSVPGLSGYHPCTNYGAGCLETTSTWSLEMTAGYTYNPGGAWSYPVTAPSLPVPDNPLWTSCHHDDGLTVRAACDGYSTYFLTTTFPLGSFGSSLFTAGDFRVPNFPLWAGSTAAGSSPNIQTYPTAPGTTLAATLRPSSFIAWRHYNPAFGDQPFHEDGYCTYTAANITGNVYKLSGGSGCYDNPADPKRTPVVFRANPYLLKDVSGPSGNVASADLQGCLAWNANECGVAGSARGEYYVNVANATYSNGCTNLYQYTTALSGSPRPCAYNVTPVGGRLTEDDAGFGSAAGLNTRLLTYAHSIPGGAAQLAYPTMDSTGRFVLASSGILDGKRHDVLAILVPPLQYDDGNRSTYVPIKFTYTTGRSGDTRMVCWGYAEDAPSFDPASGLYPMPRQEGGCSDSTGASPFVWTTSDGTSPTSCASGCTVTVNAIPNRVLYYREYLNGNAGPLRVRAVN